MQGGGGGGGVPTEIFFYIIFVEGKQSYQMLFTGSKNIDPCRIYRIFKIAKHIQLPCGRRYTRDYLKISNFDTKNLSSPTVFELETCDLAVILLTSFLTTCFSRIFELGP